MHIQPTPPLNAGAVQVNPCHTYSPIGHTPLWREKVCRARVKKAVDQSRCGRTYLSRRREVKQGHTPESHVLELQDWRQEGCSPLPRWQPQVNSGSIPPTPPATSTTTKQGFGGGLAGKRVGAPMSPVGKFLRVGGQWEEW